MPLSLSHPLVALIAFEDTPFGLDGLSVKAMMSQFTNPSPRPGFKQPQSLAILSLEEENSTEETHEKLRNYFSKKSDALYLGLFENRNTYPTPPDPTPQNGLMLGLTSASSPNDEDAFNEWYDTTHAADALKSGFFSEASRYNRLYPTDDSPRYLAFYSSPHPGPEALGKLINHYKTNPSPISPLCRIHHVWTFSACPMGG